MCTNDLTFKALTAFSIARALKKTAGGEVSCAFFHLCNVNIRADSTTNLTLPAASPLLSNAVARKACRFCPAHNQPHLSFVAEGSRSLLSDLASPRSKLVFDTIDLTIEQCSIADPALAQ
jgi:hypothetical protein